MSLSTSSFKTQGEWRVIVSLMVCLLLLEGGTRIWIKRSEARVSLDALNIRSLSHSAEAMQAHRGHKVLILGNSLAQSGVLTEVLRESLKNRGHPNPQVFPATPSGSTAMHWDYALNRYFLRPGRLPDEIFVMGHPWHFTDRLEQSAKLQQFYIHDADFGRALSEMPNWDAKVSLVLARLLNIWGVKTGLKERLFAFIIPDYTEMEIQLQRMRWAATAPSAEEGACTHLGRILDESAAHTIRIHLVAMPSLRQPGRVEAAVLDIGADYGVDVIDLSSMAGLDESCYLDGFHLNSKGAQLFTRQLARVLERGAQK